MIKPPQLTQHIHSTPARYMLSSRVCDQKDLVLDSVEADPRMPKYCHATHERTYWFFKRHTRYIP